MHVGMAALGVSGAGAGVVAVHGGAKYVPEHLWEACLKGIKAAARRGHQVSN